MTHIQRVGVALTTALVLVAAAHCYAQSEIKLHLDPVEPLPSVYSKPSGEQSVTPRQAEHPQAASENSGQASTAWPHSNTNRMLRNVDMRMAANAGPLPLAADSGLKESFQPSLSIETLENIARGHNPTLAQAAQQIEALRGKYVQKGLYPNPVIGYLGEEIGDDGQGGQQGGYVGQEIITAGKLRLNRAVVSHEIAIAQRQWEIQSLRVLNDVRASAYEVIAAQRMVDLNQQLLHIGEQGLRAAEQLFQAKEVSRVDVLQARIEANSARLQLENARNDYRAAWQRMTAVVGVPDMQMSPLDDVLEAQLPVQSWGDSLVQLNSASPELAQACAQVERAKCFLARQQAERVANFDLEAGVQYDNATQDNIASIRIAAPLKIFNRNQGNIRKAEAELTAACQNVRRVELSLQNRLATVFRQYMNAKQQVDLYRNQILPDARKSLDLVQQGYRQGEFGYLELLTAQRTYFQTNAAYVRSLRTLWVSNTLIDGMLLSNGLMAPGK